MGPDDETWPAAPEAEAFKLAIFALVRLKAWEPLAAAVLDGDRPVSRWWPVAYALQRINDPRAVPALTALLRGDGRYTAAFAARGLGTSKTPAAAAALLPLLDPGQPREVLVRSSAPWRSSAPRRPPVRSRRSSPIAPRTRTSGSRR